MTGYVSSVLEKLLFALRQRGMRAELVNSGDVELLGSRAIVGAIALALEAAVSRLPETQREALLGAKDFVSLQASGLDATRRSLAGR